MLNVGDMALAAMPQDKIRELIEAIKGQIDIAAARLLADGVDVDRLMLWVEQNSTDRGVMVDGVKVFTVSTTFATFPESSFALGGTWDASFQHLADCDKSDDEAKVAAMALLVPSWPDN